MNAGLLQLLPMPKNPIEREWFVVHRHASPLPDVAAAFERFLRLRGQRKIDQFLEDREANFVQSAGGVRR